MKNTTINGVDCSGLTVVQAEEKLTNTWNSKSFSIILNDGKSEKLTLRNMQYDISEDLDKIKNPGYFSYVLHKSHIKKNNYTISMNIKAKSDEFEESFNELSVLEAEKDEVKTKDAYIDLSDEYYKIVPEVNGNNIDKTLLEKDVLNKVKEGTFSITYKKENYYDKPEIISTSPILKEEQRYLKNLDLMNITYQMPSKDVEIEQEEILKLYGITNSTIEEKMKENKLTVNKSAVKKFVSSLANKFNTTGRSRNFKSVLSGKIAITGGDYGYLISKEDEIKKLTAELKKKKDIKRKPCYSQTPYNSSDEVGDSYVEIDLTNQKLWVFKNGEKMLSTDIVTGDESLGYSTPAGIYYLKYKQEDTTLKGNNADGSSYATPVDYWMPFNGGIGMHDASWRSKFGGKIYKNDGSHGCVNMPPKKAKKTYEIIEENYPIVVHY